MPGDVVSVTHRFTPGPGVEKKDGMSFVKLKKNKKLGTGWLPIMRQGVSGVVPSRR